MKGDRETCMDDTGVYKYNFGSSSKRERVLNKNQDVIEIYYLPNSPWISLWFLKFASHASWVFHIDGTGGKKKALISIMASLRSPCHTFPLASPNQLFCGKHGHGMTSLR